MSFCGPWGRRSRGGRQRGLSGSVTGRCGAGGTLRAGRGSGVGWPAGGKTSGQQKSGGGGGGNFGGGMGRGIWLGPCDACARAYKAAPGGGGCAARCIAAGAAISG